MSVTKKLKNKKGVTLVEMLCVVVVLTLVSGLMIMGINLGMKVYETSITEAEARMLSSTLTTAITDELMYAKDIQSDGTYFSDTKEDRLHGYGHGKDTVMTTDDNGYVILTTNSRESEVEDMYILSPKAYTRNCKAEIEVNYNESVGLFTVELKILSADGREMIESTFTVCPINV